MRVKPRAQPNQTRMSNPAGLRSPVSGNDRAETVTTVQPRMTMPQLLHRPFDIRSFTLTGLFVLAVFYTIYFMRAVLLAHGASAGNHRRRA